GSDNRWAFSMLTADADNATTRRALSTAVPATNTSTHLIGVFDAAAGQIRLYVNGVPHGRTAHSDAWNATGGLQVGRAKWNGNPVDFFPGAVDEVRTYAVAFSDADAAAAFRLNISMLARFPFTESTGIGAADVAGGHGLALAGGAGWTGGVGGSGLNLSGAAFAATTGAVVDT